jgi:hypothetical protein
LPVSGGPPDMIIMWPSVVRLASESMSASLIAFKYFRLNSAIAASSAV